MPLGIAIASAVPLQYIARMSSYEGTSFHLGNGISNKKELSEDAMANIDADWRDL